MALVRRGARLARRRACAAAALLAAALAAAAAGARLWAPPRLERSVEFPRARAAQLAHLLADISAHTLTEPGSWTLDEEAGNYTSWRYAVSYACGPRCEGRARVEAHEGGAAGAGPRHGAAPTHRVRVRRQHCARLPLLPWPSLCEEVETLSVISSAGADGSGARLQQSVSARCGAAAALLARCAGAAELRGAADALLLRVRDRLHNRDYRLRR